jgi:glucokinase
MPTTGKRISIGLDIGGTRLKALALQQPHGILHQIEVASHASEGPEEVRNALRQAVETFKEEGFTPSTIGIGCAGSVDPRTGVVRNSPNFGHWKDVPLREWAELDFNVPVSIENDANCAVFAEWKMGNGQGMENLILLTLGTGVGGGLILNNSLFHGSTGTGGELGHFSIYADGEQCNCGNRGCLERYCSGTALRRNAGDVSSKEVFARPKEPKFAKVIEKFLSDFKVALVSLANTFDPDAILLGGQVSLGVTPYLPELQEWVAKHAFPAVGAHMQILPAKFGNLSGSLGAALLALSEHPMA